MKFGEYEVLAIYENGKPAVHSCLLGSLPNLIINLREVAAVVKCETKPTIFVYLTSGVKLLIKENYEQFLNDVTHAAKA
jgi:hypothetical protein